MSTRRTSRHFYRADLLCKLPPVCMSGTSCTWRDLQKSCSVRGIFVLSHANEKPAPSRLANFTFPLGLVSSHSRRLSRHRGGNACMHHVALSFMGCETKRVHTQVRNPRPQCLVLLTLCVLTSSTPKYSWACKHDPRCCWRFVTEDEPGRQEKVKMLGQERAATI